MKKLKQLFFNLKKHVKLDYSFLIALVISIIIGEFKLYLCSLIFVLLHELVHLFVAKKLGYMSRKIHLSFFGASLEGLDDFSLNDELKVIVAGPLFNLFVVICCYLSFWFYPESYNFLYEILISNLALFLFNFLPIYPLDFGRIILALYTKNNTRKVALKKTKNISIIFLSIAFFIYLVSISFCFNITFGLVCLNLANLLFESSDGTSFKRELFILHKAKLIKRGLIEKNIYISSATPLYTLFKFIDDYHYFNFIFLDNDFNISHTISEAEFYRKTGFL